MRLRVAAPATERTDGYHRMHLVLVARSRYHLKAGRRAVVLLVPQKNARSLVAKATDAEPLRGVVTVSVIGGRTVRAKLEVL